MQTNHNNKVLQKENIKDLFVSLCRNFNYWDETNERFRMLKDLMDSWKIEAQTSLDLIENIKQCPSMIFLELIKIQNDWNKRYGFSGLSKNNKIEFNSYASPGNMGNDLSFIWDNRPKLNGKSKASNELLREAFLDGNILLDSVDTAPQRNFNCVIGPSSCSFNGGHNEPYISNISDIIGRMKDLSFYSKKDLQSDDFRIGKPLEYKPKNNVQISTINHATSKEQLKNQENYLVPDEHLESRIERGYAIVKDLCARSANRSGALYKPVSCRSEDDHDSDFHSKNKKIHTLCGNKCLRSSSKLNTAVKKNLIHPECSRSSSRHKSSSQVNILRNEPLRDQQCLLNIQPSPTQTNRNQKFYNVEADSNYLDHSCKTKPIAASRVCSTSNVHSLHGSTSRKSSSKLGNILGRNVSQPECRGSGSSKQRKYSRVSSVKTEPIGNRQSFLHIQPSPMQMNQDQCSNPKPCAAMRTSSSSNVHTIYGSTGLGSSSKLNTVVGRAFSFPECLGSTSKLKKYFQVSSGKNEPTRDQQCSLTMQPSPIQIDANQKPCKVEVDFNYSDQNCNRKSSAVTRVCSVSQVAESSCLSAESSCLSANSKTTKLPKKQKSQQSIVPQPNCSSLSMRSTNSKQFNIPKQTKKTFSKKTIAEIPIKTKLAHINRIRKSFSKKQLESCEQLLACNSCKPKNIEIIQLDNSNNLVVKFTCKCEKCPDGPMYKIIEMNHKCPCPSTQERKDKRLDPIQECSNIGFDKSTEKISSKIEFPSPDHSKVPLCSRSSINGRSILVPNLKIESLKVQSTEDSLRKKTTSVEEPVPTILIKQECLRKDASGISLRKFLEDNFSCSLRGSHSVPSLGIKSQTPSKTIEPQRQPSKCDSGEKFEEESKDCSIEEDLSGSQKSTSNKKRSSRKKKKILHKRKKRLSRKKSLSKSNAFKSKKYRSKQSNETKVCTEKDSDSKRASSKRERTHSSKTRKTSKTTSPIRLPSNITLTVNSKTPTPDCLKSCTGNTYTFERRGEDTFPECLSEEGSPDVEILTISPIKYIEHRVCSCKNEMKTTNSNPSLRACCCSEGTCPYNKTKENTDKGIFYKTIEVPCSHEYIDKSKGVFKQNLYLEQSPIKITCPNKSLTPNINKDPKHFSEDKDRLKESSDNNKLEKVTKCLSTPINWDLNSQLDRNIPRKQSSPNEKDDQTYPTISYIKNIEFQICGCRTAKKMTNQEQDDEELSKNLEKTHSNKCIGENLSPEQPPTKTTPNEVAPSKSPCQPNIPEDKPIGKELTEDTSNLEKTNKCLSNRDNLDRMDQSLSSKTSCPKSKGGEFLPKTIVLPQTELVEEVPPTRETCYQGMVQEGKAEQIKSLPTTECGVTQTVSCIVPDQSKSNQYRTQTTPCTIKNKESGQQESRTQNPCVGTQPSNNCCCAKKKVASLKTLFSKNECERKSIENQFQNTQKPNTCDQQSFVPYSGYQTSQCDNSLAQNRMNQNYFQSKNSYVTGRTRLRCFSDSISDNNSNDDSDKKVYAICNRNTCPAMTNTCSAMTNTCPAMAKIHPAMTKACPCPAKANTCVPMTKTRPMTYTTRVCSAQGQYPQHSCVENQSCSNLEQTYSKYVPRYQVCNNDTCPSKRRERYLQSQNVQTNMTQSPQMDNPLYSKQNFNCSNICKIDYDFNARDDELRTWIKAETVSAENYVKNVFEQSLSKFESEWEDADTNIKNKNKCSPSKSGEKIVLICFEDGKMDLVPLKEMYKNIKNLKYIGQKGALSIISESVKNNNNTKTSDKQPSDEQECKSNLNRLDNSINIKLNLDEYECGKESDRFNNSDNFDWSNEGGIKPPTSFEMDLASDLVNRTDNNSEPIKTNPSQHLHTDFCFEQYLGCSKKMSSYRGNAPSKTVTNRNKYSVFNSQQVYYKPVVRERANQGVLQFPESTAITDFCVEHETHSISNEPSTHINFQHLNGIMKPSESKNKSQHCLPTQSNVNKSREGVFEVLENPNYLKSMLDDFEMENLHSQLDKLNHEIADVLSKEQHLTLSIPECLSLPTEDHESNNNINKNKQTEYKNDPLDEEKVDENKHSRGFDILIDWMLPPCTVKSEENISQTSPSQYSHTELSTNFNLSNKQSNIDSNNLKCDNSFNSINKIEQQNLENLVKKFLNSREIFKDFERNYNSISLKTRKIGDANKDAAYVNPKDNLILNSGTRTMTKLAISVDTIQEYTSALRDLSFALDDQLNLMITVLKFTGCIRQNNSIYSEDLKSKAKMWNNKQNHSKALYKQYFSVEKTVSDHRRLKKANYDILKELTSRNERYQKSDDTFEKNDGQLRVSKSTLRFVQIELMNLKSEVNMELFQKVREKIASALGENFQNRPILQCIDMELFKIRNITIKISQILNEVQHTYRKTETLECYIRSRQTASSSNHINHGEQSVKMNNSWEPIGSVKLNPDQSLKIWLEQMGKRLRNELKRIKCALAVTSHKMMSQENSE